MPFQKNAWLSLNRHPSRNWQSLARLWLDAAAACLLYLASALVPLSQWAAPKEQAMIDHLFFYVGLSFILAHEMDAIRVKEWKMFPFLAYLKEETAYLVFTGIHLPLYILLFWGLVSDGSRAVIIGLNIFFVIHLVLHILFIKHRDNQFKSVFSWVLIIGAATCGAIDLLLSFW